MLDFFAENLHLVPLAVFTVIYFLYYFWPLLRQSVSKRLFRADLSELQASLKGAMEEREMAPAQPLPDDNVAAQTRNRNARTVLNNLEALQNRKYSHHMVRETAAALRANFPSGDYRRFELDQVPFYGRFMERVSAARLMSGLFILLGLLGTMIKLNGAIREIEGFANVSSDTSQVIAGMQKVMGEAGGAFDSSIAGLGLMVLFLIAIAIINRSMQYQAAQLDEAVTLEVIPNLALIHTQYMPDLDPIRHTGAYLETLNTSVNELTVGMQNNLKVLSDHIGNTMERFGTFDKFMNEIDKWGINLKDTTEGITKMSLTLDQAAMRLKSPIDQWNSQMKEDMAQLTTTFNAHIASLAEENNREYLKELIETMYNSIEKLSKDNSEHLKSTISSSNQHLTHVLSDIKEINTQSASLTKQRTEQLKEEFGVYSKMLTEKEEQLNAHTQLMQSQLEKVAAALDAASNVELKSSLAELGRVMNRHEQLIDQVGTQLDSGASSLKSAAQSLKKQAESPTLMSTFQRFFSRNKSVEFEDGDLVDDPNIRFPRKKQQKGKGGKAAAAVKGKPQKKKSRKGRSRAEQKSRRAAPTNDKPAEKVVEDIKAPAVIAPVLEVEETNGVAETEAPEPAVVADEQEAVAAVQEAVAEAEPAVEEAVAEAAEAVAEAESVVEEAVAEAAEAEPAVEETVAEAAEAEPAVEEAVAEATEAEAVAAVGAAIAEEAEAEAAADEVENTFIAEAEEQQGDESTAASGDEEDTAEESKKEA